MWWPYELFTYHPKFLINYLVNHLFQKGKKIPVVKEYFSFCQYPLLKGEEKETKKKQHKNAKEGSNCHSENVNLLIVALFLLEMMHVMFGSRLCVPIDPYMSGWRTTALWHRLEFFVLTIYKQLITFWVCIQLTVICFFSGNYGNEGCSTNIAWSFLLYWV